MSEAKKITILGGGISALTTAWYLTSQPGWKERYDITVHQMGWRLGGKGASGRNAKLGDRIEEHGLHIFFGFYENAFRLMRDVYEELGRHPAAPLATWDEAFKPHNLVVMEEHFRGEWHHWPLPFPPDDGVPGDGQVMPSPADYIERLLNFVLGLFRSSTLGEEVGLSAVAEDVMRELPQIRNHVHQLWRREHEEEPGLFERLARVVSDQFEKLLSAVVPDVEMVFLHVAIDIVRSLDALADEAAEDIEMVVWLLERFRRWVFGRVKYQIDLDLEVHRFFTLVDLTTSVMIGLLADGVVFPEQDWYKIDDLSLRQWLARHGARASTCDSTPVQTLEDAVYARGVGVGAGTILYSAFRLLLTYKGALMYKMQAGMGDVIFGPLYEALRRRGVKFRFFHEVTRLELQEIDGKKQIGRVHIGVQATVKDGRAYQPLVDVKGLPSWPSEPLFDQLDQGAELVASGVNLENWWRDWPYVDQLVLEAGTDFDLCVLGISIGAWPYIAQELIGDTDNPRLGKMVEHVRTTQTKGEQVWLRPSLEQLGWSQGPAIGIAYASPYDTWADMSHLLARETWSEDEVSTVIYNTSNLLDDEPMAPRSDHDYPLRQHARVRAQTIEWWSKSPRHLFPNATQTNDPNALNWYWLFDPEDRDGVDRIQGQFDIAVWTPSDRYVMSVPGSNRYRLRTEESGYPNLLITGDFLLTSIAAGCAECATQAGMSTSRAISGHPKQIVGEWLPRSSSAPLLPADAVMQPLPAENTSELPDYIRRDGDMMAFPPYLARGTSMYNFLLPARLDRLQALCDEQLNLGGPIRYKPLGPLCAFVASAVERMGSTLPGYQTGWVKEEDYGFWVPVVAGRQVGDIFYPQRLCWFMPYLWVDSGVAAEGGREIFGFNKSVATLTGPTGPGEAARFTVDTLAIPVWGPGSEATVLPLIDVRRADDGLFADLAEQWHDVGEMVASVVAEFEQVVTGHDVAWLPTLQGFLSLIGDLATGTVPMVFLKQFPSIVDGRKAAYQAICECRARVVGGVKGGLMAGDWEVALKRYDSHRMVERLGLHTTLDAQGWHVAHVASKFWMRMDFSVDTGTVIYERARGTEGS